ncbi:macrophage mannose receptor 1-like [Silurus meridionalis]|uniref:macrophage mannose receptor 1-like n=1 Tax=Silurus meridionalis TaxID=175797 RepID=UPI001EEA6183|nr:macrophage mannose receptor 1-like [Silurus meridionalis]
MWQYNNQHCTAVSFRDSGQWTDENCFTTRPFICYNKSCTGSSCTHHQYHFINENKTWTDAQRYCRDKYTDLATVDNMEEMNMLRNTVNETYSGLAWIGLYDDLNSWKWSLDDDSFYMIKERSFRNWYISKPLNWNGNSLCVYISSFNGEWWVDSCSVARPFICFDGRVNASESYILVYKNMNWTDAQRYCRDHYTDLISVRNETENQKIRSFISNFISLNPVNYYNYYNYYYHYYYYYYYMWIGLYRTRSWSDKSNSSFNNWKPGQPDNYAQDEFCTAVSFTDLGKWTDENCVKAFPFLCYKITASSSRQYYFVNENKTWTEAQKFCRKNYTDLATIDNMEEMDSLLMTANDSYSGLAWIGLYDDLDSWRWSLDNDTFYQEGERDYRGWSHQPDNYYGNELCASINYRGEWFDQPCTDKRTFVCYNGTHDTYVWIYNLMTWEEAQRFCRANHRDLASVRNETELQRIVNIMNSYDVWIGLYRNRLWSDQSSSTFTYWRPEIPAQTPEPDNGVYSSGQNGYQHCTAVDRSGHWTDEHCLYSFPFICYTAFTPDVVTGLRIKVKAKESLLHSEIPKLVLMEFYQELNRLGLSSNISVNVIKKRKFSP